MRSDAPAAPCDILDELLRAPAPQTFPGQEALSRLIRRAAAPAPGPAVSQPVSRPRRPAPVALPTPAKPRVRIKTTQYLDAATHARLGQARDALAALPASPGGGRLSKSRIVETALRHALEEFEAQGPQSRLARALQHPDEA